PLQGSLQREECHQVNNSLIMGENRRSAFAHRRFEKWRTKGWPSRRTSREAEEAVEEAAEQARCRAGKGGSAERALGLTGTRPSRQSVGQATRTPGREREVLRNEGVEAYL
ncbi:hypothetical protein Dimus_027405, partial [Dionaea muscipula]